MGQNHRAAPPEELGETNGSRIHTIRAPCGAEPLTGTHEHWNLMSLITRINRSRAALIRVVAGAALVTLVAGGATAVAAHKTITLEVDGETVELTTFRSDLDSVLASSGYELGDRDRVVPAQGTSLSDGDSVTLNRAKQITITVDGEEKTVWTTAATVEDALRQFAYSPDDVKISASRSQRLPLDGMELEVNLPKKVVLTDGDTTTEIETPEETVAEMLERLGEPLEQDDTTDPGADEEIVEGMTVTVERIRTEEETVREEFEPERIEIEDDSMAKGEEVVEEEAVPGDRTATYEVTTVNGEETERKIVDEDVHEPGTPATVRVGTKEAPHEPHGIWDTLAHCESTGDWSINTGNGFHGGLQFTRSTWNAFGGGQYAATADQATREQQIEIAKKVQAQQGWGAWPSCSAKAGLR